MMYMYMYADYFVSFINMYCSLCLHFFHLLARKSNLEKNSIFSSKFFHNFQFYLSWASGKWVSMKTGTDKH